MKRFVIFALAVLLLGIPVVTLAQTGSSPGGASSSPGASSPGTSTSAPAAPSASPSTAAPSTGSSDTSATSGTSSAGQASPSMPASAEDCKNDGWQKFGLKSEAECAAKIKK